MQQAVTEQRTRKNGQRGIRRHLANQGGVLPRIRYKVCGRTFLLCINSASGRDKILATVHDLRSAKAICEIINDLRSEITELKKQIAG